MADRKIDNDRYYAKHKKQIYIKNKQWRYNNSERYKAWRKNNADKVKKYNVEYREKHRDSHTEARLKDKYGITLANYTEIFNKQNGNCAICGINQSELKKKLSVDHNHDNKKVRGLLCHQCNVGIGMFKDSPDILKKAIRYLKK